MNSLSLSNPALLAAAAGAPPAATAVDWLLDFTGTTGDLITETTFNNSTLGSMPGSAWEDSGSGGPDHTFLADPSGLTRFTPLVVDGVSHSAPTKLLKFDFDYAAAHSITAWDQFARDTGSVPSHTITLLVQLNGVGGSVNSDLVNLASASFSVPQHQLPGNVIVAHGSDGGSTLGGGIPTENGQWYILTFRHNNAPASKRVEVVLVDNDTGELVACSHAASSADANMTLLTIQDYLGLPDSGNNLYALIAGKAGGTFPLDPLTVPPPDDLNVSQYADNTARLLFDADAINAITYLIERNVNSGGWETLETDWDHNYVSQFLDAALSDGDSVAYRVTALIGDFSSPPVTADPLTINNSADVVPSGRIGWWKFDEASGTTAVDSSGNGYNATLTSLGGTFAWATGHVSGDLSLTTYYVALPGGHFNLATATSEITLAAWIKLTVTDTAIFAFGDSGNNLPLFYFVVGNNILGNSGTGKLAALVRDNAGNGLTSVVGATAVNDGAWHHVAITRNSSKLITIYLDGVSDGSGSDTMGTGSSFDSPWLGYDHAAALLSQLTNVDDARIYSRALTGVEVALLAAM